ncbi:hypothetical protein [Ralstonia phage phiITL-1]|uniref:Uncharacterized protein n=1 Tax=Ralstonia phage phiITL-1 TaxID=1597967 RepID=A0A0U1ZDK7_9CAUD|nr:hypothetical protein HOR02_gp23 [Ralstonia phage phiITL-1]AJT60807.1 hypothetical protein [Ralstonia phage phiITL-1]
MSATSWARSRCYCTRRCETRGSPQGGLRVSSQPLKESEPCVNPPSTPTSPPN